MLLIKTKYFKTNYLGNLTMASDLMQVLVPIRDSDCSFPKGLNREKQICAGDPGLFGIIGQKDACSVK